MASALIKGQEAKKPQSLTFSANVAAVFTRPRNSLDMVNSGWSIREVAFVGFEGIPFFFLPPPPAPSFEH